MTDQQKIERAEEDTVDFTVENGIAWVKFNRPEKRNCIGPTTHVELVEAWTRFRDDPSALVAIITGAGGGIGYALAQELARRGARLLVNDYGGFVKSEYVIASAHH